MDITVVENPELDRFEALLATGEVAGFVTYEQAGTTLVLVHTEVFDRYEGQGIGSALVQGTLSRLRDDGRRFRPVCPFITAYLERHPEYAGPAGQDAPGQGSGAQST